MYKVLYRLTDYFLSKYKKKKKKKESQEEVYATPALLFMHYRQTKKTYLNTQQTKRYKSLTQVKSKVWSC